MWAIPCACISGRWHSVQHHAVVSRPRGRKGLVVIESFVSVATGRFLWRPWRQCVIIECQYRIVNSMLPSASTSNHAKNLEVCLAALPAARAIRRPLSSRRQQSPTFIRENHRVFALACFYLLIADHYLTLTFLLEKHVHVCTNLGLT